MELSYNISIKTFKSFSKLAIIIFVNLEVRLYRTAINETGIWLISHPTFSFLLPELEEFIHIYGGY